MNYLTPSIKSGVFVTNYNSNKKYHLKLERNCVVVFNDVANKLSV